MQYYVALVHTEPKSDFGVSFPDFPGCISAGSTLEEAAAMGAEALAGHIAVMSGEGLDIPAPTPPDVIAGRKEFRTGVPVMIPAPAAKPMRAVRINITVPADMLPEIDRYAADHGFNRSGFLAAAAKKMIDEAA